MIHRKFRYKKVFRDSFPYLRSFQRPLVDPVMGYQRITPQDRKVTLAKRKERKEKKVILPCGSKVSYAQATHGFQRPVPERPNRPKRKRRIWWV